METNFKCKITIVEETKYKQRKNEAYPTEGIIIETIVETVEENCKESNFFVTEKFDHQKVAKMMLDLNLAQKLTNYR